MRNRETGLLLSRESTDPLHQQAPQVLCDIWQVLAFFFFWIRVSPFDLLNDSKILKPRSQRQAVISCAGRTTVAACCTPRERHPLV